MPRRGPYRQPDAYRLDLLRHDTNGGAYGDGNVFCVNTNGSGYKDLLNFNGTTARIPTAA